jgi:NAD(P)-dependent dehydrogenase (short-subunit alcohol dehydrogenase family)
VYGALKAAVIHLSQTLALDLGQYGVRMNLVGTGPTPPADPSLLSKGSQFHGFIKNADKHPGYAEELLQMTPLKQFGTNLDTARAVLYLASDVTGRHLTGQIIGTDGGIYMPK